MSGLSRIPSEDIEVIKEHIRDEERQRHSKQTKLIVRFTKISDDLEFFIETINARKTKFKLIPKTTVRLNNDIFMEIGEIT
jgi:hypothetical protein